MYLLWAYLYFLIFYLVYNVCNKYERIICQKLCDNVNLERLKILYEFFQISSKIIISTEDTKDSRLYFKCT